MTNEHYVDAHLMHSEAEMEEQEVIAQFNEVDSEIESVCNAIASYEEIVAQNEHKMAELKQETKVLETT